MPQLHHRDPSIIGLLGASPHLSAAGVSQGIPEYHRHVSGTTLSNAIDTRKHVTKYHSPHKSEAFDDHDTPPLTPVFTGRSLPQTPSRSGLHLDKGQIADMAFERPFYEMIVDGIHSHPNSVRVRNIRLDCYGLTELLLTQLAYTAYPEGCILITDGNCAAKLFRCDGSDVLNLAMKILDPHLCDGPHEWRDGKRFVKEGDRLYLEGTDTLAGRFVLVHLNPFR